MTSSRRWSLIRVILPALIALAAPAHVRAQKPEGRIAGVVADKSTGGPIHGATVVSLADGRSVTTDSSGSFKFDKLPTGIVRFLVRAKGFPSAGLVVALAKGESLERRVDLDSTEAGKAADAAAANTAKAIRDGKAGPATGGATGGTTGGAQALPMVSVEATASLGPRFANFERRRRTGAGHYIVREDIEKSGLSSLQDVARGVRGVTVECGGGLGCYIRMVRAPMRCLPEYIVDDNVDNVFGPTVSVRDIEALEIYTGPADVPGEYAGRNAGCGVIVIWTRAGPTRKPAKKP